MSNKEILLSFESKINYLDCESNIIIEEYKWLQFKDYLKNNKDFYYRDYLSFSPMEFSGKEYNNESFLKNVIEIEDPEKIKAFKCLYGKQFNINSNTFNEIFNDDDYLDYLENLKESKESKELEESKYLEESKQSIKK